MEIIKPASIELGYTLTEGASSQYPDWVSGTSYNRNDIVYSNPSDGGDGKHYLQFKSFRVYSTTRPENSSYWEIYTDAQTVAVADYITDATVSYYSGWTSGAAVGAGERRYWSGRDYEAAIAVSAGDNTSNPAACLASFDADIKARWIDLGPSNAFCCVDDEAATATRVNYGGSLQMTLFTSGPCDRIGLWACENIASVSIDVSAGEMVYNSDFTVDAIDHWTWVSGDASLVRSSGSLTITNNDYATDDMQGNVVLRNLKVGTTYVLSGSVTCDAADEWQVWFLDYDYGAVTASSGKQTGSGSFSLTWTADVRECRAAVYLYQGTEDITLNEFSIKQSAFTPETVTATLEDATTGICRRKVIIPHTLCASPKYEITLTGQGPGSDIRIGLVSAGEAVTIGCTHAQVSSGGNSYSGWTRNEYGDIVGMSAKRRRRSAELTATVQLGEMDADLVDQVLHSVEGQLVAFDFNNDDSGITRLLVHGVSKDWDTVVYGYGTGLDTLQITVESLVETING